MILFCLLPAFPNKYSKIWAHATTRYEAALIAHIDHCIPKLKQKR